MPEPAFCFLFLQCLAQPAWLCTHQHACGSHGKVINTQMSDTKYLESHSVLGWADFRGCCFLGTTSCSCSSQKTEQDEGLEKRKIYLDLMRDFLAVKTQREIQSLGWDAYKRCEISFLPVILARRRAAPLPSLCSFWRQGPSPNTHPMAIPTPN